MSRMNKNNRGKEKGVQAHKPDMGILMYIIIMSVFGLAMVFDASVFKGLEIFNNQYYFVQQQIGWIILGSVVGILSYLISYKYLVKISPIGFVILLFLLIFTLIVSKAVNGAKGWIDAGTIFSIQPTEFLKPIFIAFSAFYFSNERKGEEQVKHKRIYLAILVLTIIPILLQPDFGSAMVIIAIGIAIYFISDTSKQHFKELIIVLSVGLIAILILGSFASYRVQRLNTWTEILQTGDVANKSGDGYQMYQTLIGIGSGGMWGKGFGQSRQRFGYLPENTAFTDSIVAVYLEEFGYMGGIVLILSIMFFLWKCISIANRVSDRNGKYLIFGLSIWIVFQSLLNIAVNIGLLPLTGITLPFISYGGSSMISLFIGAGLILNVSRYTDEKNTR